MPEAIEIGKEQIQPPIDAALHDAQEFKITEEAFHECGIAVVRFPRGGQYDVSAAEAVIKAGIPLKNRGKEASGVAVLRDDGKFDVEKGLGIGIEVFPDRGQSYSQEYPDNYAAAYQARYGTQGSRSVNDAQPFHIEAPGPRGSFHCVVVHNGNFTNTQKLREQLFLDMPDDVSDTQVATQLLAEEITFEQIQNPDQPLDIKRPLKRVLEQLEGSFTLAVMTDEMTIAVTDRYKNRPGHIGNFANGGAMVGSEVTSLDAAGATWEREMEPAEMFTIYDDGSTESEQWTTPDPHGCWLELAYFQKEYGENGTPAVFHGVNIHDLRLELGRQLALELIEQGRLPDLDVVFGVPNSAVTAGKGFAEASGIAYKQGLVARDDDRSFIATTPEERQQAVRRKISAVVDILAPVDPATEHLPEEEQVRIPQRAAGVEDSLIRGTTYKAVADITREGGASEVHGLIALAKFMHPCVLGVDVGTHGELLAADGASEEAMAEKVDLDGLAFVSLNAMRKAIKIVGGNPENFCEGCFTGEYPPGVIEEVPVTLTKK